jgi:hypothetical protein
MPFYYEPVQIPPIPEYQTGTWEGELNNTGLNLSPVKSFTGLWAKLEDLVHIEVDITLSGITSFGNTGLTITLPFESVRHMDFWGGTLHDTNTPTEYYSIKGHLEVGSSVMQLWFIDSDKDEPLTPTNPITLNSTDRIHLNGWYAVDGQ